MTTTTGTEPEHHKAMLMIMAATVTAAYFVVFGLKGTKAPRTRNSS
jgi:hypothetical protein